MTRRGPGGDDSSGGPAAGTVDGGAAGRSAPPAPYRLVSLPVKYLPVLVIAADTDWSLTNAFWPNAFTSGFAVQATSAFVTPPWWRPRPGRP